MQLKSNLKKGMEIIISIDSLAFGGKGVARYNNIVIFVKNGIPGQKLKVLIIKKSKNYFEAKILEIISESKYYQDPVCEHFKYCGGCSFQNLDYQIQTQQKLTQVKDIFNRIGNLKNFIIEPIEVCNNNYKYRIESNNEFFLYDDLVFQELNNQLEGIINDDKNNLDLD